MNIRTRLSISADGYVTTPDGWPANGMRLSPAVSADADLTLESASPLPGGSVEIVYSL